MFLNPVNADPLAAEKEGGTGAPSLSLWLQDNHEILAMTNQFPAHDRSINDDLERDSNGCGDSQAGDGQRPDESEGQHQHQQQQQRTQPQDEDAPSVNDVKRALRQNFRDTGVIDDVTARLRRQFVSQLRRQGLGVPGARDAVISSSRNPNSISLRERVLHSLVVDHLASNGLLQSLAVFLPESGLGITAASTAAAENDGKYSGTKTPAAVAASAAAAGRLAPAALSREDVLQGLTISEDSAMFRRVLSRASDREGASAVVMTTSAEVATGVACGEKPQRHVGGLLEAVMAEIAAKFRAVAVDSCAQTDEIGRSHKENLVSRLEAVREKWLKTAKDERQDPAQDMTEQMLAYQRECESRATAKVKADLESFRERDLAALRVQMTSSRRRELDATRKELQSQYDTRVQRLEEMERNRDRRSKERLRDAEVSQFEGRQNLLREMDLLRTREQEVRRGAELDARAVRAEELRLRDLAVSLEGRSEEIRRREREGARVREDAVEAAKHEARQTLQVKEEGVAQEREFLRQEMKAVHAERKSCQEQLSQHTATARALQEARSDALAAGARAVAAEAEAERASEQAAVYKEAYRMRREVAVEGDMEFIQLGRQELEERIRSLEAASEEEEQRYEKALRRETRERDDLRAENVRLRTALTILNADVRGFRREREHRWEDEATELRRALASTGLERDGAERRAQEEECERTALEGQVEELRLALRRSRDAIESIRLCDIEAESSATVAVPDAPLHLPPASADRFAAGLRDGSLPPPMLRHERHPLTVLTNDKGICQVVGEWNEIDSCGGDMYTDREAIAWRDGRLDLHTDGDGGHRGVRFRKKNDGHSRERRRWESSDGTGRDRVVGSARRKRRGSCLADLEAGECWSDGDIENFQFGRDVGLGDGPDTRRRIFRGRRRERFTDDKEGGENVRRCVSISKRSVPRRSRLNHASNAARAFYKRDGYRGSQPWQDQENGRNSADKCVSESWWSGSDGSIGNASCDEGGRRGIGTRGRRRRLARRSAAVARTADGDVERDVHVAAAAELAASKRIEAVELLLAEERERMATDLEAERARWRQRDAARDEERRRELEADRQRREEMEVESMRRRLAQEEEKAALVSTAARRRESRFEGDRHQETGAETGKGEKDLDDARVWHERGVRKEPTERGGSIRHAVVGCPQATETTAEMTHRAIHGKGVMSEEAGSDRGAGLREEVTTRSTASDVALTAEERAGASQAFDAVTPPPGSPEEPTGVFSTGSEVAKAALASPASVTVKHARPEQARQPEEPHNEGRKPQTAEIFGVTAAAASETDGRVEGILAGGRRDAATNDGPDLKPRTNPPESKTDVSQSDRQAHVADLSPGASVTLSKVDPIPSEPARKGGSEAVARESGEVLEAGSVCEGGDDVEMAPKCSDDAEDIATAQADREVQAFREKIRQRRQQQQQQKQQASRQESQRSPGVPSAAAPNVAAASPNEPPQIRAGNAGTAEGQQMKQGSRASSAGGSVSEISEPSIGATGILDVDGRGEASDPTADAQHSSGEVFDTDGFGGGHGGRLSSGGSENDWF